VLISAPLTFVMRVLVGARPQWVGCRPSAAQRIYFANHTSHIDTLALWSALPRGLRATTRPVAAADYWDRGGFRSWLVRHAFNPLFVERHADRHDGDPLAPLAAALDRGASLILFPEGTRRAERTPGPFKSGLYHLAQRHPHVELVPVYLQNLYRSMPKGALLPVPLTCMVRFGAPLLRLAGESRPAFLERARQAVVELA